ncbi:S-adenosyl-L-methionine-dependent methyltransferase [Mycena olivaceomarginata]|nr:S-adenosyl-L-methionine-dependent methyltransferase [Mycena olivaceomarginata]
MSQAEPSLARSVDGLPSAHEWPTLRKMLGDISNVRVLDLGCGFGYFCRWAQHEAGARSVHGVDVSARMLERAREFDADMHPQQQQQEGSKVVSYSREDLETITLEKGRYDLVYSSLALHYLPTPSFQRLVREVRNTLIPGGRFVFSVEHPIFTAPISPDTTFRASGEGDARMWPLDSYADEGPRVRNWLAAGVIKQHRTVEAYVSGVLEAEFVLKELREWMPSEEYVRENPTDAGERDRPLFLLIAAEVRK